MVNKLVSIRFSKSILDDVSSIVESEGFSNLQEFVRNSVRESVQKHKLQQSILELKKLSGSQKITPKTKKEVEAHIKKVFS